MKMIMAVVRPDRYEEVKEALKAVGVMGMTFTRVTGHGMQAGIRFTSRVGDFVVDEIEKVEIQAVVDDEQVDTATDAICRAAYTGHPGDGRIFVMPVERSYRISEYQADP